MAEIGSVTRTNWITLSRLNGRRNRFPADRCFDNVVNVAGGETVARGGFLVHIEIEEITADSSFGKSAPRVRKIDNCFLDLQSEVLDPL